MIDEKTLAEFKGKLVEEKKKLEGELSKLANKEGEEDYEAKFEDLGRSEEDNAEEVENYTTNIGITETLEKSLIEVNDALDRVEAGTYGKCDACKEKDIRIERLNAYPAARLCMTCAEKE